jgi:hypothetical protein
VTPAANTTGGGGPRRPPPLAEALIRLGMTADAAAQKGSRRACPPGE